MEKEEKKKVTKKSGEPKKATKKKAAPKKEKTPISLNETVNLEKDKPEMNPDEVAVVSGQMCIHCHNYFDKGLTICPHCRKRQTNNSFGLTIAIVFGLVFLLFIIAGYFVDKYMINTSNEEEYKTSCKLVSYENLIRVPKDYKNQKIKLIGTVVSVSGIDDGYGNEMTISLNANLFENGIEQIIQVNFRDKDYSQGFMQGDLITVYGEYTAINGNEPEIDAEYIVFGN